MNGSGFSREWPPMSLLCWGDILLLVPCSKRSSRVQNKALQRVGGGVGWKPGVVTAGHSHTSPSSSVEIRSETRCGFICPRTDKKSSSETGEPTAALRGSILSPQEVVTLFWKRRPIIFGPTG